MILSIFTVHSNVIRLPITSCAEVYLAGIAEQSVLRHMLGRIP